MVNEVNSRVLIATPVFEYHKYCINDYIENIERQSYQSYDLILVDNSPTDCYANYLRSKKIPVIKVPFSQMMRDRTVRSRNLIRDIFLKGEYTHLLFLDQDVMLPKSGLETLLSEKIPIITGIYSKTVKYDKLGTLEFAMIVADRPEKKKGDLLVTFSDEMPIEPLFKILGCGFGCLLITRDIIEKISFRYEESRGGDMCFSDDVIKAGYSIYCTQKVKCTHKHIIRDFEANPSWGYW